jgi:diaminohydroxyphosphoribosylaminopyrimidine deaminase/5-amino-6-(5-phosphoribosylamino)uracil reductase
MVSNDYTNRLVHRWRSEEQAILVGTNTALQDDPSLTNRRWPGTSPLRIVLDMQLRLPSYLQLFTDGGRTVIFNGVRSGKEDNCQFYQLDKNKSIIPQMLEALYALGIQSVLVEGGARLLQSFIDNDAWDEVRVITNTKQTFLATENEAGCRAPVLRSFTSSSLHQFSDDRVQLFKPLAK